MYACKAGSNIEKVHGVPRGVLGNSAELLEAGQMARCDRVDDRGVVGHCAALELDKGWNILDRGQIDVDSIS